MILVFLFCFVFFMVLFFFFFFFFFSSRRRHTRSKRDWSSDVCSSDLQRLDEGFQVVQQRGIPLGGALAPSAGAAEALLLGRGRGRRLRQGRQFAQRSEERRVGKECRARWGPEHEKKTSRAHTMTAR